MSFAASLLSPWYLSSSRLYQCSTSPSMFMQIYFFKRMYNDFTYFLVSLLQCWLRENYSSSIFFCTIFNKLKIEHLYSDCASYPKHTFCRARGFCPCFNLTAGNICCANSLTWKHWCKCYKLGVRVFFQFLVQGKTQCIFASSFACNRSRSEAKYRTQGSKMELSCKKQRWTVCPFISETNALDHT